MAFSTSIRTLELEHPKLFIRDIILPIAQDDPRFREFFNGAYVDYYGVFSWQEVRDLNEKRLADTNFQIEDNLTLKQFLEDKDNKGTVFLINDYEWESGMGD